MTTRGIERIIKNTRRVTSKISSDDTERAVYAILSHGAAVAATLTPVDTSTLINSQYAPQIRQSQGKTTGHVGYTAEYAYWVHEMPGKLKGLPRADFGQTREGVGFGGGTGGGYYWGPNAEPKFLEKGMEAARLAAPGILRKIYRV